jgi:RecA/RadA recombinase
VHHLDDDCTNDNLDNLQLIDPEEHWKLHITDVVQQSKTIKLSEIVSIRKIGKEPTFDITMEAPHHNFVANGFIVHNSTGKTLLAIEAAVNFQRKYAKGRIRYREGEAAFSKDYVTTKLGMPLKGVDFGDKKNPARTIEDLYEEIEYRIENSKQPELMIVDSLDSFSTRAELARKIDTASYGTEKARLMSDFFRRINSGMSEKHITMMIISQIRDKIGVLYGRKWTRSGGKALTFYSSQTIVLKQGDKIYKQFRGIKRAIGIDVQAYIDKNKVGASFADVKFPILFNYGIDDEAACRSFLASIKVKVPDNGKESLENIHRLVEDNWVQLMNHFDPGRRKYT